MLEDLVLKNAKSYYEGDSQETVKTVVNTIKTILELSDVARYGGLLALEEYAKSNLSSTNRAQKFMKQAIVYILNGTESDVMRDLLSSKILVEGADTFVGYIYYIAMHGMLLVHAGTPSKVIGEHMCNFIPDKFVETCKSQYLT